MGNTHNKEQTPRLLRKEFMNILTKATVLVLNRNWQAINVRTPQEAFCMMATNVATGLEIEGEDHIRPVTWEEWIILPIRDQDEAVHTVRGQIRVPTVIVAVNYAKVPKKRPKLCAKAIRERDAALRELREAHDGVKTDLTANRNDLAEIKQELMTILSEKAALESNLGATNTRIRELESELQSVSAGRAQADQQA